MFNYVDGKKMMMGDRVLFESKHKAIVDLIVVPGTSIGKKFPDIKEPTFFLKSKTLGLFAERSTSECDDLVLLSRAPKKGRKKK